jgi:hypothetical protein
MSIVPIAAKPSEAHELAAKLKALSEGPFVPRSIATQLELLSE